MKFPKLASFCLLIVLSSVAVTACSSNSGNDSTSQANNAPRVVETSPKAGDVNVDPTISELSITFDKEMNPDSYSIVENLEKGKFPEIIGKPVVSADKKTFTQKIKLEAKTNYYISINSDKFNNFRDSSGTPAVPYLLEFETR